MKKLLIVLSLIALMAGCSNTQSKEEKKEKTSEPASKVQEQQVVKDDETKQEAETVVTEVTKIEPLYEINQKNWSVVPIGDADAHIVLLTVDDAPDKHALEMAHTLSGLGVKAIFFVNGHFLDTEEEANVLKEIHNLGFPIGNHTYSHRNLKDLNEEEQIQEIISVNDRVEEIIGERPKFFRAPFGVNTDVSRKVVADEKMILMNWTYGYDWEKDYQSKEALADIMVNTPFLKNGANLLMHDRAWTNEALADIVKGIQAKGFEMVDPNLIRTIE